MPRKNKRAAQGSGTIRQRPDGRWEARFTTGRDPGTGKQIQKSVYGATQAEVRRKLAQATTAIDEGLYTEPARLTVGQWLDIWSAEYLGGVKPRTIDSYKSTCKVHLKPALGAIKLSALPAHAIQTLYNGLHRDKNLSPKSIKNTHGVLHKALQQAVELGYIKHNPADAVKLPRIEKKEIKPLDSEATSSFLEAVQGHRFESVYLVTLFTGMRQGEAIGLTWDCVDFEKGVILIDRQLQRDRETGEYVFVPPKGNKSRRITPALSVMEILREQRKKQAEWHLRAGQAWDNTSNLVFTNEIGRNLSPQTVYTNYKKLVRNINVPDARFHDLRHSYAIASLQSGVDIATVQRNLGHHTSAFTLDTYGHITDEMRTESALKMEAFIQRVKSKGKIL